MFRAGAAGTTSHLLIHKGVTGSASAEGEARGVILAGGGEIARRGGVAGLSFKYQSGLRERVSVTGSMRAPG